MTGRVSDRVDMMGPLTGLPLSDLAWLLYIAHCSTWSPILLLTTTHDQCTGVRHQRIPYPLPFVYAGPGLGANCNKIPILDK